MRPRHGDVHVSIFDGSGKHPFANYWTHQVCARELVYLIVVLRQLTSSPRAV